MRPIRLPAKRHKYGAKAIVIDGIRFASKREAKRWGELKLLEKSGAIVGLELQPRYPLTVWRGDHSDIRNIGEYRGDFRYVSGREGEVVEDVKGFKTPLYRWKKRHVEAQYGITVVEL